MKTRTTKHSIAPPPPVAPPVDTSVLEKLFDQAPDVTFLIKDVVGCYLAVI